MQIRQPSYPSRVESPLPCSPLQKLKAYLYYMNTCMAVWVIFLSFTMIGVHSLFKAQPLPTPTRHRACSSCSCGSPRGRSARGFDAAKEQEARTSGGLTARPTTDKDLANTSTQWNLPRRDRRSPPGLLSPIRPLSVRRASSIGNPLRHIHGHTRLASVDGMRMISLQHPRIGLVCNGEPPLVSVVLACFTSGYSAEHISRESSSPGIIPPASNCNTETDNCTASCQQMVGLTNTPKEARTPRPPLSPLITCCILPRAPVSLQPSESSLVFIWRLEKLSVC